MRAQQLLAILTTASQRYLANGRNDKTAIGWARAERIQLIAKFLQKVAGKYQPDEEKDAEKAEAALPQFLKEIINKFFIIACFAAMGINPDRSELRIWLKGFKSSGLYDALQNAYAEQPSNNGVTFFDFICNASRDPKIAKNLALIKSCILTLDNKQLSINYSFSMVQDLFDSAASNDLLTITQESLQFHRCYLDELQVLLQDKNFDDYWAYFSEKLNQVLAIACHIMGAYDIRTIPENFSYPKEMIAYLKQALPAIKREPNNDPLIEALLKAVEQLERTYNAASQHASQSSAYTICKAKILLLLLSCQKVFKEQKLWPNSDNAHKYEGACVMPNSESPGYIFLIPNQFKQSMFALSFRRGVTFWLRDLTGYPYPHRLKFSEATECRTVDFIQITLGYLTGANDKTIYQAADALATKLFNCKNATEVNELLDTGITYLARHAEINGNRATEIFTHYVSNLPAKAEEKLSAEVLAKQALVCAAGNAAAAASAAPTAAAAAPRTIQSFNIANVV